jgi:hypothetical protein
MGIFRNLKRVHAAVAADLATDQPTLSAAINNAAIKAIMGGIESDEFKSYMAIFASNQEQLQRLTVPREAPPEPKYLSQMRAYIVANAICDTGTNAHTGNKVTEAIDGGEDGIPLVSDEITDLTSAQGQVLANLRPDGLKNIPGIHS